MATQTAPTPSVRAKDFEFPVSVEWIEGKLVAAMVDGKQLIEIASPPVFRGTHPAVWSPEDFLVASAASCLAVTFAGLAAREGVVVTRLVVDGSGVCGVRDDGRFGFTRMRLTMRIEADPAEHDRARTLAEKAEATCVVAVSLDLPVETVIKTEAPGAAER
jgi:organic hydroperoxide reductase OsmC/OhrA